MRLPRVDREPLCIGAGERRLRLKEFRVPDSTELFDLRNHPSIRRGMRDTAPISWQDHQRYVAANLAAQSRMWLFLVVSRDTRIGMTLLRDFLGDSAEIGVMLIDAERHRRDAYFASHMTAWFGFEVLGLARLVSKVPRGNDAAFAFNRKCGFVAFRDEDADYHYLAMDIEHYRHDPTHRAFRARWPIRMLGVDG